MDINMKDTLRTLRVKKNVTQETLAKHLGITPQSVGKWERGEGYPDITLLPAIALYFGVTVDELLNVDRARIEEKIEAYFKESSELRLQGEIEKDLALWERAHAEFPNDCSVMLELVDGLVSVQLVPGRRPDAERVIALCRRILNESDDTRQRERATAYIISCYQYLGDTENALLYADQLPDFRMTTRERKRAEILDGEEGIAECQKYLAACIYQTAAVAQTLASKKTLSAEEKIAALTFAVEVTMLPFSDGNYGKAANTLSMLCGMLAAEWCLLKNTDKTLEYLEKAAKFAIHADQNPSGTYTAPVVNRISYSLAWKTYKGYVSKLRLEQLRWGIFKYLRENERFRKIEAELKKYAEE